MGFTVSRSIIVPVVFDLVYVALAQGVVEKGHDHDLRGAGRGSLGEGRRAGRADEEEEHDEAGGEYHDAECPLAAHCVRSVHGIPSRAADVGRRVRRLAWWQREVHCDGAVVRVKET